MSGRRSETIDHAAYQANDALVADYAGPPGFVQRISVDPVPYDVESQASAELYELAGGR